MVVVHAGRATDVRATEEIASVDEAALEGIGVAEAALEETTGVELG
jgi:hypothetical protein